MNPSRYANVLKQKDAATKYVNQPRKLSNGAATADSFAKELQKL